MKNNKYTPTTQAEVIFKGAKNDLQKLGEAMETCRYYGISEKAIQKAYSKETESTKKPNNVPKKKKRWGIF